MVAQENLVNGTEAMSNSAKDKNIRHSQDQVTIVEVSPRDGLPAVCEGLSTADEIMYINKLSETGIRKIESVTFTHPRLLPKEYNAEQLIQGIHKKPGITYVGLVPNEIGCRRALVTNIDEILVLVSASDTFNRLNVGRTLRESLNKMLPTILDAARKSNRSIRIYILTAFGCPYTGKVPPEEVVQLVLKLSYLGATEIVLVDSTGMANPRTVKSLIGSIRDLNLDINLAVHFHNTRGTAIANCIAAYEAGVRIFDTSLGGMSGTPYGAVELDFGYWNVPTEDLVHVFEEMGIKTGIDFNLLMACVQVAEKLAGKPLPGHLLRALPATHIFEIPDYLQRRKHLDV